MADPFGRDSTPPVGKPTGNTPFPSSGKGNPIQNLTASTAKALGVPVKVLKTPPPAAKPDNPLLAGKAPSRGGPVKVYKQQPSAVPVIVNAALGLLGTNTKALSYAVQHPVGRLQEKGPFAPPMKVIPGINNGKPVPVVGGSSDVPWLPGSGAIKEALGLASGGRTAAEAAAHLDEARAFWKAQMPHPPLETPALKLGEATPETGGEAGAKVRAAFTTGDQTVPEARQATAALQSAERGKRFSAGAAAREQAGGGTPGQIASLGAQKGELPFQAHPGLAGTPEPVYEAMAQHVGQLPTLREGEKLTAIESLRNWWMHGKPPTEGEQVLLEHAFGKNVADAIATDPTFRDKLAALGAKGNRLGQEAFLLPRAFKAAFDLSAMLRQNLLPTISHPIENAKLLPSMVRSTVSEPHFQGSQVGIVNDQNFPLHWAAKTPFTDIGASGAEGVGNLGRREEQFASNLAEKMNLRSLPGLGGLGKLGTGPGDLIRASDRGYVGLLNPSRQKIGDRLFQKAALAGEDLTDPKVMKAIGSATGALTGRGSLGPWLEKHAVTLNALLFSPRFAASRFNLLGFGGKDLGHIPGYLPGSYYANLYRASPTAAKEVATSMRNLAIVAASVLYAASKAGALVSNDPTNADFGKIRVGNTRVDILAGLQTPVRMMAQEALQKETSSQTGKVTHLGGNSFTSLGRLDPAWKFASSKASPLPGFALQQAGLTQKGQSQKTSVGSIAGNLFEPLSEADARAQYKATHSIPAGILAGVLSGTGVGIQNYKSPVAKVKSTDPFARGGTSKPPKDPLGRGAPTSSSKDPFGR